MFLVGNHDFQKFMGMKLFLRGKRGDFKDSGGFCLKGELNNSGERQPLGTLINALCY